MKTVIALGRLTINWGKGRRFSGGLLLPVVLILLTAANAPGISPSASASTPDHVQPALMQMASEHPAAVLDVIVQKTSSDKSIEATVERLGGTVTTDLSIIHGFAASIPAIALTPLARLEGVRWISLDAPVQTSATTAVSTAWAVTPGVAVANTFSNNAAITDSAFGPNGTYGVGIDAVKGSFAAFDLEETEGNAINKVEVLLAGYSPFINHDFHVKVWLGGKQAKDLVAKHDSFASHTSPTSSGVVAVDITSTKTWAWADLDNQLEIYLDLGGFDTKDSLYLDAIGLRVTSAPGNDPISASAPTSLPKGAIDTSRLVNVYNKAVRAPDVWNDAAGLWQGQGLTVAVVDSGVAKHMDLGKRLIAKVNLNKALHDSSDRYGHGTFVASIIGGDGTQSKNQHMGIAPKTNLINVRVSDDDGMASESDTVAALQWVLTNHVKYNIRVVNLSLNSSQADSFNTSPLDAACEILWFNQIVVVVSAGNNGTGVLFPPANDPFVITVGAADDKGTVSITDDSVAPFSAYGKTELGGVKPDLVAPGKNIIAFLPENAKTTIARQHPGNMVNSSYFRMSGTSMAAPIVSGAVALLLQDEPGLTPDQVKFRLTATANKTWGGYNATIAGSGYLDIYAAVKGTTNQSANNGFLISKLLFTGSNTTWSSANWNSANWNSANWNSANWNSVDWGSANWNSDYWGQ